MAVWEHGNVSCSVEIRTKEDIGEACCEHDKVEDVSLKRYSSGPIVAKDDCKTKDQPRRERNLVCLINHTNLRSIVSDMQRKYMDNVSTIPRNRFVRKAKVVGLNQKVLLKCCRVA